MCELSPWSYGPLLRPVHGGLATRTGWRAAATEGGSSPWEHLEKEGAEGNLTEGLTGWCDGEERPAVDRKKWRRSELVGAGLGGQRR
jgi:hypothetical protein